MGADKGTKVVVPVTPSWGAASTLGVLGTLLGVAGTTVAAIKANDWATVAAGVGTASVAITTLGGRFAQAVAIARAIARDAKPIVDELAK